MVGWASTDTAGQFKGAPLAKPPATVLLLDEAVGKRGA
jgi:hypothetical protein